MWESTAVASPWLDAHSMPGADALLEITSDTSAGISPAAHAAAIDIMLEPRPEITIPIFVFMLGILPSNWDVIGRFGQKNRPGRPWAVDRVPFLGLNRNI